MSVVWRAMVMGAALAVGTPASSADTDLAITTQGRIWTPAGSQRVSHPQTPSVFGTNDVVVYCFTVPGYGGDPAPATVARISRRFVALNGNGREFFVGGRAAWLRQSYTVSDRPQDHEENRILDTFIPSASAACRS